MKNPRPFTSTARTIAVLSEPAIAQLLSGQPSDPASAADQAPQAAASLMDAESWEKIESRWLSQAGTRLAAGDTLEELFAVVEHAKREWESAIDALPDLVCLVDHAGAILRVNRIVEEWLLGRVDMVRGLPLHRLLHPVCTAPDCYLAEVCRVVVEQVVRGEPLDREVYDPVVQHHLRIHARPVLDRSQSATYTAVVTVSDITERRRVELERERLIADLDAYAHTVAHDLKNPVGVIMGYAEFLDRDLGSLPPDEIHDYIQIIGRVSRKLNDIIDDLLLFAEIQDTQVQLRPLDMSSVVAGALERLRTLIDQHAACLTAPAVWPAALGHHQWVEEVWMNYVSNAVKYSGPAPQIELGFDTPINGQLRFWVRDHGDGIPPEQQARLFSRFGRTRSQSAKGHGLGLSIVQRIIEKLGGQVGVDSCESAGSLFYFTLPAADAPVSSASPAPCVA